MTLIEVINNLTTKYPQTYIEIETFDIETKRIRKILQPKYLFRGESSLYPKTETTFFRKSQGETLNSEQWSEVAFAVHHLYLFLREEIWNISVANKYHNDLKIDSYIAGLLQHYGFDTSFIDLSSDLNVIAHFCSDCEISNCGSIFVIPTENIIDFCYDLTQCPGERPRRQKAFALLDFKREGGLDLKDKQFLIDYSAEWVDFTIDEKDKIFYKPDFYYPLKGDKVAQSIIDWYDNSDITSRLEDSVVVAYLNGIITKMRKYCG